MPSTEPRIEHRRREADGWKVREFRDDGAVHLQVFEIAIAIAEVYQGLLPAEGAAQAAS